MVLISVCIPAYNRPRELGELLDSIAGQDFDDFEVVVSEDCSPAAQEIEATVGRFAQAHPHLPVHYSQSPRNLGYDGNLRSLAHKATGDYCLYMGDDDFVAPGGLAAVARVLRRHGPVGAALRTWTTVDPVTRETQAVHRYFGSDRYFPPGVESVVTFFRRFVAISGLVVNRLAALRYDTSQFDGTLLYQLHLVANLVYDLGGVYVSDTVAMARGGHKTHYFGSSEAERENFAPRVTLPEHSVNFMRGMLAIARHFEQERGVPVYRRIATDISHYSYPVLSIQAERLPRLRFARYALDIARLGLGRSPLFLVYFVLLFTLGPERSDWLIERVRGAVGRTPTFGRIYQGEPAERA